MKIPQLKKKPEIKSCHNISWEDNYSWIHQNNILEVLKDSSKLLPEVKKYLEEENSYTEFHLSDTKNIQKKLFDEIKGRIKLDDESLPYKDYNYEYWTKTTTKGNYSIKLRKKEKKIEILNQKTLKTFAPYHLLKTMRAGVLVLGPLLAKYGTAKVSLPGGCAIGPRPINLHLNALKKMGANIKIKNGYIVASAKKGLSSPFKKFKFL